MLNTCKKEIVTPATTLMEANLKLKKLEAAEVDITEYQRLIGSLMYGSIGTRFNITHDIGVLSHHIHAPGKRHHTAIKQVFHYLQGTSDTYILYDGNSDVEGPVVYCDADWAGDPSDCKSVSGYMAIVSGAAIVRGPLCGIVLWSSYLDLILSHAPISLLILVYLHMILSLFHRVLRCSIRSFVILIAAIVTGSVRGHP